MRGERAASYCQEIRLLKWRAIYRCPNRCAASLFFVLLLACSNSSAAGLPSPYAGIEDLQTTDRMLRAELSIQQRSLLKERFPGALIAGVCAGSFSAQSDERSVVLLQRVKGKGNGYRLSVVVLLAKSRVSVLDWMKGPAWAIEPSFDVEGGQVFVGQIQCLPPQALQRFIDRELATLKRVRGGDTESLVGDSLCFLFDGVYSNWQCFRYNRSNNNMQRWGYQVHAD